MKFFKTQYVFMTLLMMQFGVVTSLGRNNVDRSLFVQGDELTGSTGHSTQYVLNELDSLLAQANKASEAKEFSKARKMYLQAFQLAQSTGDLTQVLERLQDVSQLYEQMSVQAPALFDSLKAEPYSWDNYYFKVSGIRNEVGGSSNRYAVIPVSAAIGLKDEVVTFYGAIEKDNEPRSLAWLMEGEMETTDSANTIYRLRAEAEDLKWDVREGDLLVVEYKGADFEGDVIAESFIRQIHFKGNYRESPLTLALLISRDYPFYKSFIEEFYHAQVAEIYEVFREDSLDLLMEIMTEGLFTGITGMEALGRSTIREERQFFRFALEHLGTYMGSEFKFAEAYATWIIQRAPMSGDHFLDYFLSYPDSNRSTILSAYLSQILQKQYQKQWERKASDELVNKRLPQALKISALCLELADLADDRKGRADILFLQSKIYAELNQDQRSLRLAESAGIIYSEIGDREAAGSCKTFVENLQRNNGVEVVVQGGHTMPFELVFHPDGQFYYTGGWDGFIKMWDYRSGLIVKEVNAHELMINSLSVSADGRFLLSVDDWGYLKLFNAYTLDEVWTYRHKEEYIGEADINADGSLIAYCGGNDLVYVLSVTDRKLFKKLKRHKGKVTSVRFHPGNEILMSAGRDSMVYTWNIPDFSERGWYRDGSQIYHISISPDGRTFALLRRDSSISFWDFYGARRLGIGTTTFSRMGSSVFFAKPSFSPDNRYAVYMFQGEQSYISILRLSDLKAHNFKNPHDDIISTLCFHPGGEALVSASHDLAVKTYDLSNYEFRETGTLRIVTNRPPAAPALQVNFDSSGTHLIALINGQQFALTDLNLINGERRLVRRKLLIGDQDKFISPIDNQISFLDQERNLYVTEFDARGEESGITGIADVDYYQFYPNRDRVCIRTLIDGHFSYLETQSGKELLRVRLPNSNTLKTIYNFTLVAEENLAYAACNSPSIIRINLQTGAVDSVVLGKPGKLEIIGIQATSNPDLLFIHSDRIVGLWNRHTYEWIWKHTVNPDDEVFTSVAISHDLNYVALASYTYAVRVMNIAQNKVVWESKDFGYFISNLAFNPRFPLLAVSCEDMNLSIFNYRKGTRILRIFPQQNGDMILMNNEGRYWADKRSLKGLAFKVRNNIYPVEQFDVLFNRPGDVLQNSPVADASYLKALKQATARRLIREGLKEDQASFALPNVLITNRSEIPRLSHNRFVDLKVECSDYVDSLSSLHVSVNGVPIYGTSGKKLDPTHFLKYGVQVQLGYGSNQIKVWCKNNRGLSSLRESLEINVTLESPRPDLYIGVMAVSDYTDDSYDLKYPVKDAKDIVDQLGSDTSTYNQIHVLALHDGDVIRENLDRLGDFYSKAGVNDRIVLFVTGHGVLDEHYEFFYATSDLDFEKPALRGISYPDIESVLELSPARQRLLLMDACHSGELDRTALTSRDIEVEEATEVIVSGYTNRGAKTRKTKQVIGLQNSFNLMRELFADVGSSNGIQVISAASGDSYALESDQWQNGVFTYSILKGMRSMEADRNRDGMVYVSELRDFVIREVYEQTKGKQRPTVRSENIEFDFLLR